MEHIVASSLPLPPVPTRRATRAPARRRRPWPARRGTRAPWN